MFSIVNVTDCPPSDTAAAHKYVNTIFNDQGLHVTSVVYPGETVRRRTAQGLWRAAPPESVNGFRAAVERSQSG